MESKSKELPPDIQFSQIEYISASGHELNIIYDNFRNIPFVEGCDAIIWCGDFAKFIFANCMHLMFQNRTYPPFVRPRTDSL